MPGSAFGPIDRAGPWRIMEPMGCEDFPITTAQGAGDDLRQELAREYGLRKRAECTARIHSDAVQLALDLLVRERDVSGFFQAFIRTLVEECNGVACGVWLLDDDATSCELWMAHTGGRILTASSPEWVDLALPRDSLSTHLYRSPALWTDTIEYTGDDERLPAAVRAFNADAGIDWMVVAPLRLSNRNLGWIALSTSGGEPCESMWRRALVDAIAKQATLALHHSRVAEQGRAEVRRQAVLEERNRIARDIHDTLAQGFAAILMQLQAAQRSASLPPKVAKALDTAVDLARTHMIEARRSVCALRPQDSDTVDIAAALQRMTDLARRTTEVPIELTIEDLPSFGGGVEPEIIGIAQEALTNAVRHSRARRIAIHAAGVRSVGFRLSISDDGRGIAKDRHGTGFGMTSMQERADRIGASLTIVTAPRAGTEVVLAWEPPSFSIPRMTGEGERETRGELAAASLPEDVHA